jgi:hypothetical protein
VHHDVRADLGTGDRRRQTRQARPYDGDPSHTVLLGSVGSCHTDAARLRDVTSVTEQRRFRSARTAGEHDRNSLVPAEGADRLAWLAERQTG